MARSKPFDHKLDPQLRMATNGSRVVNALRAERSAALAVPSLDFLKTVPLQRGPFDRPVPRKSLPKSAKRGKMSRTTRDVEASVFVELVEGTEKLPAALKGAEVTARRRNFITARIPLSRLHALAADPSVVGVQAGERVAFSPPVEAKPQNAQPGAARGKIGEKSGATGKGVLVGIIDVQGFDFAHPDFIDAHGRTRFIRIWDQGGQGRPKPRGFSYGAELTADHLNTAINASPKLGLPATVLEPQSQATPSSHGTHVASIAAGNAGVAPGALLAGVLIELPKEDEDRRSSFYDSSRIAHAVDYLFQLGEKLGMTVSVNVSLGTNGHAHDASSAVSRWIDHALTTPGRSITVAAGNAGQEAPAGPGDWGFIMGRIHSSGTIPAAGLARNLEWVVAGDGIADLSENEMNVWYAPQDRFAVEVKPPGEDWLQAVEPGEYLENVLLRDGTFVSVYNERYAPANGQNTISIYLSPFLTDKGVVGVRAGTWQVRLIGREVRDGRYHAWIERDDPRRLGRAGLVEAWSFPSFFSSATNVDDSSVSSLACGHRVVSVANLDDLRERVHITSSQGPTADGREKPETAAPGTEVVAANGFDPEHPWVAMTGTSMAAPYVAGVVALMLEAEPRLTAAQIGGILRRTARPLPGADFTWRNDAGFGRIDPVACVEEARAVNTRLDIKP